MYAIVQWWWGRRRRGQDRGQLALTMLEGSAVFGAALAGALGPGSAEDAPVARRHCHSHTSTHATRSCVMGKEGRGNGRRGGQIRGTVSTRYSPRGRYAEESPRGGGGVGECGNLLCAVCIAFAGRCRGHRRSSPGPRLQRGIMPTSRSHGYRTERGLMMGPMARAHGAQQGANQGGGWPAGHIVD